MTQATRPYVLAASGVQEWRLEAACRDTSTALFFDEPPEAAKQLCAGCPVRADCLEFAIVTHQDYGVYGGLSEKERERLRRRRHQAARRGMA